LRLRSSKVSEFSGNQDPVYDFLLVINSNLGPKRDRQTDSLSAARNQLWVVAPSTLTGCRQEPMRRQQTDRQTELQWLRPVIPLHWQISLGQRSKKYRTSHKNIGQGCALFPEIFQFFL